MTEARRILNFIHYAEGLKTELRRASRSDNMRESVAGHCWRLTLLLILVVPKLKLKVDLLKILKMAIIHDLVEIEAGDTPILESVTNGDRLQLKYQEELAAMTNIKEMLGVEGQEIYDLWVEFEELETNEAKVLRSLDMLEGQLQFLTENVTTFDNDDQEIITALLNKTSDICKIDPFLSELDKESLPDRQERIKH